jgi:hypothetical protein
LIVEELPISLRVYMLTTGWLIIPLLTRSVKNLLFSIFPVDPSKPGAIPINPSYGDLKLVSALLTYLKLVVTLDSLRN